MPFLYHVEQSLCVWWAVQDLNLRPLPCKGNALPTELTARRKYLRESSLNTIFSGAMSNFNALT